MKTALVRTSNKNLKVIRDDYKQTNAEFVEELRGNGFKVLKVWNRNVEDSEIDEWEFINRK